MTKLPFRAPARCLSRDEDAVVATIEGGMIEDRAAPKAPSKLYPNDLRKNAGQAGSAVDGAVTHPGGKV